MKIAAFDCETIPGQSLSENVTPEFDPDEIKTGAMGPAKAQEKVDKERAKFEEGLDKKMSTDKDLCQVTTFVGYIYTTSIAEEKVIDKKVLQWPPLDEEYEVIHGAWDFIRYAYNANIPLVSFGGKGFDLPVLFAAAMRLDIPVSRPMYDSLTFRYENARHYDLMRSLTGETHPVRGKSLEFYLNLFQLGNKTEGMDGSQVYPAWQAKEYTKISEYCEQDVFMTAKLFERVEPWMPKDTDEVGEEIEKDEGQELSDDELWIDKSTIKSGLSIYQTLKEE